MSPASYNRLFPNQDFLPQRGLGNLIALPLQGRCRSNGTSVFLDPEMLEPWPDQLAFLSSLKRIVRPSTVRRPPRSRALNGHPNRDADRLSRDHPRLRQPP